MNCLVGLGDSFHLVTEGQVLGEVSRPAANLAVSSREMRSPFGFYKGSEDAGGGGLGVQAGTRMQGQGWGGGLGVQAGTPGRTKCHWLPGA